MTKVVAIVSMSLDGYVRRERRRRRSFRLSGPNIPLKVR